jgi:hypothetical protein
MKVRLGLLTSLQIEDLQKQATELVTAIKEGADLILEQIPYANGMWLRGILQGKVGKDIIELRDDCRRFSGSGRRRETTWALSGNARDRRRARNTMGYQVPLRDGEGTSVEKYN